MFRRETMLVVEALRSGTYTQGKGVLESGGCHCCLGVACRVAIADGVPLMIRSSESGKTLFDDHAGDLPQTVMEWLGVDAHDPCIGSPKISAVYRNDMLGQDFSQIADAFEAEIIDEP